jgi:hypothetical protein
LKTTGSCSSRKYPPVTLIRKLADQDDNFFLLPFVPPRYSLILGETFSIQWSIAEWLFKYQEEGL